MNLQRSQSLSLRPIRAGDGIPAPAGGTVLDESRTAPFFRFDLARSLQLHRRLAMGFALAGLALAAVYVAMTWPVYVAQSQVYVQPVATKIVDQDNNNQRWPYDSNSYDSFIEQQVQNASNPDVLVMALHKLGPGPWLQDGESDEAAAVQLGRTLQVKRLGSSYQIAINAEARDAGSAAQIANAVADSLVEAAAHDQDAGDPQRLAILRDEQARVQKQLNADLSEQDTLNGQLGMAAVGTEPPDLIDNAIASTREELIKARTAHDEAAAQFAAMDASQGASSSAIDAEADELMASDAGLTSMKTSLNQQRATLITQMANLTPDNPEYKLDAQELTKINTALDSMMKELRAKAADQIEEKLRTNLEQTAGVEARLNGQLNQLVATAASATPRLQRENDLATDIVRLRNRYATVDEELHNLMLQDSVPGAVHVSVVAAPPLHPTFSMVLKKALPLLLGGLLLGLLAALIANNLDQRIYIAGDMEQVLGFAPMAQLPDFDEVSGGVAEEHLLRLSAAIEHARKQGEVKNCIFTGTGPGVGVTTVVTRVREMLEAMGRPTVLVNASGTPAPPRTASRRGGENGGSATESGTRSTALLRQVAERTAKQEDSLVLTDMAPLAISGETQYLARYVDCAVVVVESGTTTRAQLREAAHALQRLEVAAAGFVLNRIGKAKADPAFLTSLAAVEKHVEEQSRYAARPRRNRRTRLFDTEEETQAAPERANVQAEERARGRAAEQAEVRVEERVEERVRQRTDERAERWMAEQRAERAERRIEQGIDEQAEERTVERAEPVRYEPFAAGAAARAELPPAAAARAAAVPEEKSVRTDHAPAAARAPVRPQTEETREPMSTADAEMPWWLAESPAQQAALAAMEKSEPAAPAPRSAKADAREEKRARRAESLHEAVRAAAERPAPEPETETEEPEYNAASRLSGLRNLLFTLGLKETDRKREAEEETEPAVRVAERAPERVAEPATIFRSFIPTPEPEPVRVATLRKEPAKVVTAAPEFLPPKPARQRRVDEEDDEEIVILPSRRGQYKVR